VTDVLARIAWPLLFFSIVLFGLLALSWTLLLPRYTSIAVGDTLRTPEQLVRYKAELEATTWGRAPVFTAGKSLPKEHPNKF
jgi:hypothetical protein